MVTTSEMLAQVAEAEERAVKAMPLPEPPTGETRYAFPVIAGKVADCAQYLAQCQSNLEDTQRAMKRARDNEEKAVAVFAEARKVAEAWTKQMQDRLDELS